MGAATAGGRAPPFADATNVPDLDAGMQVYFLAGAAAGTTPACSALVYGSPKYGNTGLVRSLSGVTPSPSAVLVARVRITSMASSARPRPLKATKSKAAGVPSS